MKIKDFINYLNSKYPNSNKEEWDPSGFSVKFNQATKLKGVILALDLTNKVLQKAIETSSNLIITHHPFLFEKTKELEAIKAPYKISILKQLKKHKIFVYSIHTNYDCDLYGTSYQILRYLGLENYFEYGSQTYSASVSVKISFQELVNQITTKLKLSHFRTNFDKESFHKPLSRIAFLSGSGYIGTINELHFKGYDLIISSDFKWSDWINFKEINAKVLEIPHLDEQVFAWHLKEILSKEFPRLQVAFVELKTPFYNLK
ncbi:Nif3-like dinuclear metal center hexameric protein [Mycoplasmopsis citelli]|uniref:Nif3-like dinuclear metal center hexameric protein n=1 Tax=Mycoplasmopsis citelli TaxID=171281 RepID=UPI00211424D7|nr:Nif3-like dinuclear metal center hexameric protein [Mycoplasmopsis citelli]UUD36591.1 Nif3-like dinuclear metal center hexameric protein [Mycoplasmopsis citelli]